MYIKQIAAYLNISHDEAKHWKLIYDAIKEVTGMYDYEWYVEENRLVIVYDNSFGHMKFPLPERLLQRGSYVVDTDTPVYCTHYALNLFAMLGANAKPAVRTKALEIIPLLPVHVEQPDEIDILQAKRKKERESALALIKKELWRNEDLPLSWGIYNEKETDYLFKALRPKLPTYQFDVDGALLFTGTVRILYDDGKYFYSLQYPDVTKNVYCSKRYDTVRECIKQLDIKIERGPSLRSYRKHVNQWINQ